MTRNSISKAKFLIAEDCSTFERLLVNLNLFLLIGVFSTLIYILLRVLILPEELFSHNLLEYYPQNLNLTFLILPTTSILDTVEAAIFAYDRVVSSLASIMYYVVSSCKISSLSALSSSLIPSQLAHSTLSLWISFTGTSGVKNYFMIYASNTLLDPHLFLP